MAFVEAPETLKYVKSLIAKFEKQEAIPDYRLFLKEWDKSLGTEYSKIGKVEVAKYTTLPQEEKLSFLFMEMSGIHNLLKSSLNKNRRYLQSELTLDNIVVRLKNAVNSYVIELNEASWYNLTSAEEEIAQRYARPW